MESIKLILTLNLLSFSVAFSQTVERDVLANAGGITTLASGHTVSWTLGESFVATRSSVPPQLIITEGFQQPEGGTVPVFDLPDALGQVIVFPNPAGDVLSISISEIPLMSILARLVDPNGQNLREVDLLNLTTTIDLSGLPVSWYALVLTDGKNWVRTVKVIKQ